MKVGRWVGGILPQAQFDNPLLHQTFPSCLSRIFFNFLSDSISEAAEARLIGADTPSGLSFSFRLGLKGQVKAKRRNSFWAVAPFLNMVTVLTPATM
jgi:hypothetical protein